jgi:TRAP-type mannitol/chloroaromatic compound transport system permease large subunit
VANRATKIALNIGFDDPDELRTALEAHRYHDGAEVHPCVIADLCNEKRRRDTPRRRGPSQYEQATAAEKQRLREKDAQRQARRLAALEPRAGFMGGVFDGLADATAGLAMGALAALAFAARRKTHARGRGQ